MVEKGIRSGITYAVHRYVKANNKYLKNYDKNKESPYLIYLNVKTLYGWMISPRLLVVGFQWKKYGKFSGRLYKTLYDEYSDKGYVLEVNAEYPENVHDLRNNLPFSPE